jgi:hypothetical protein
LTQQKIEQKAVCGIIKIMISLLVFQMLIFNVFAGFGEYLQVLILFGAAAVASFGLIDIGFFLGLKEQVQKFKSSKSGLGWQLAVFVALLITMPVAWFIASWPSELIYEAISDIYVFQGVSATVIDFARILIAFLVVVGLFLAIIWLWVNVNRKGDQYQ